MEGLIMTVAKHLRALKEEQAMEKFGQNTTFL
jgi:hypothetical protein